MRAKLKLLEGSKVKFQFNEDNLVLIPVDGQSSVKVSVGVCETSGPSSSLGSGPEKRGDNDG